MAAETFQRLVCDRECSVQTSADIARAQPLTPKAVLPTFPKVGTMWNLGRLSSDTGRDFRMERMFLLVADFGRLMVLAIWWTQAH